MMLWVSGLGKGKTTSAVGQAVRAIGNGWNVMFVQFMKSWNSAELAPLRLIGVDVVNAEKTPRPFTWDLTPEGLKNMRDMTQATYSQAIKLAGKKQYNLIVIDEAGMAIEHNMVSLNQVLTLAGKGEHAYMTGHNLPDELDGKLDYHTVLTPLRHPYHDQGKLALPGIEF